jgi:glycosyltransferase involved in cell wall biosynthesis
VQRPAKLVRHLVDFGWVARVVAAPAFGIRDDSLLDEIPPEVEILRLKGAIGARVPRALGSIKLGRPYATLKRLALLGDDGFADLAETVALGIARGADADAVLATSLPFSSVVAGALIARALHKPFVADLRDPWAFAPRAKSASRLHLGVMRALERRTLAEADAVVTVTGGCRNHLPPEIGQRAIVIPNGYEPSDLDVPREPRSQGSLRIVHAGTLYDRRRPGPLLEALARVQAQRPDRKLELVMAGATHEHRAELERAPIAVDVRGYLSHRDAIALLRSADAIVGLVGTDPEDDHALPAKLFEAAALGPPILCWAREESESARFIRAAGAGRVVPDGDAIERAVLDLMDGRLEVAPLSARQSVLAPHHRRAIAQRFAELLDRLSVR